MSRYLARQIQQSSRLRFSHPAIRRYASEATEHAEVPMLLRLREDLKTAMRAKDTERLNVIKGVLAVITNAEKNNKPMDSDMKIRTHLLRQAEAQKTVAQQFEARDRKDLSEKELAQAAILEGYAAEVKVVPEALLKEAISKAIETLNSEGLTCNVGAIVQRLRKVDGLLEGKPFDYDHSIRIMKELNVPGLGVKKT